MKKKIFPHALKVGLLISDHSEYGRGLLRGIADYAKTQPQGHFHLAAPNKQGVREMIKWRPDGLIVMLHQASLAKPLHDLNFVIVNVCNVSGRKEFAVVHSDDAKVGRLAAEHLLERKAATFGFVGLAQGDYVHVRAKAFQERIRQAGRPVLVFPRLGRTPTSFDRMALGNWILSLPKPLALMACNDVCGHAILEVCRRINVRVPEEVLAIGVDNDYPMSELIWPGLSSISLATQQIGYRASVLLWRMFSGHVPSEPILISPREIVLRRSTEPLATADPEIAEMVSFIRTSAHHPQPLKELFARTSLSRMTIERRFRKLLGCTPLQEVHRVRVAEACKLLSTTDLPMKCIADRCGYRSPSRHSKRFAKRWAKPPQPIGAALSKRRTVEILPSEGKEKFKRKIFYFRKLIKRRKEKFECSH